MKPARELVDCLAEQITLPEVYRGIRRLIAMPDSKINDYVDLINSDSALSTRLIKIANTRFFGYPRKADTTEQAISLIGVMQIHDVLLSGLVMRAFAGIPNEVVNLIAFWENSVYCGIVSRIIAKRCMQPASQRFFAFGLFHDIGHIVMYAKRPELAQQALMHSLQMGVSLFKAEREIFGFDYGQLGSELMRLWHLPENFQEITQFHFEPEHAQHCQMETAIVHLAYIATQFRSDSNSSDKLSAVASPLAWELTKLNKNDDIEPIMRDAQQYVDEVFNALWPFAYPPSKTEFGVQNRLSAGGVK